jgi:pimeloyl-ACP methyl ester carboxylesterase
MGFALAAALLSATPANAQRYDPDIVRDAGSGDDVFVVLTGMIGGVGGFSKLQAQLTSRNCRVITIDPYRLSLDSTDVTFAAMARRVDEIMQSLGVTNAKIVGHSHGAGVALRLAANHPDRVSKLYFLNAGALESNLTDGVAASLRIARIISHIPGGRYFVEARLVAGLRENTVHTAWLDAGTRKRYARPVLDHIDEIASMANRFATEKEPESLPQVLKRIHVPVELILAGVVTPGGAGVEELNAIRPLGNLLEVEVVAGVGHFLQEEAPGDVARLLAEPPTTARSHTIPAYFVSAPQSRRR